MQQIFGTGSKLKQQLNYPKFKDESLRVIIPGKKYHLQRESMRALEALGHEVFYLEVPETAGELIRKLVQALVQFRPDMLLTINHIGFDQGGTIGQLLEEIHLPVAAWYVDSPEFVLGASGLPAKAITTLFMWEKSFIPQLKEMGIEDVHYLPLASDTSVFKPRNLTRTHTISFVGDSMTNAKKKWDARVQPIHRDLVQNIAQELVKNRHVDTTALIEAADNTISLQNSANVLAAGTWQGTANYRNTLLKNFDKPEFTIYGDANWPVLMPNAQFMGTVDYGEKLSQVYEQSAINLNATSLQMQTAVNQRVFDVPASGGFILTDAQEDALLHFEHGKELVTYQSPEELKDKVDYYLNNETCRLKIIEAGHRRVLASHTYKHRLVELVKHMRKRYASDR